MYHLDNVEIQCKVIFVFSLRLCHCQKELGNAVESRKSCSDAIKIDDEPRLYCDRAEAYLLEDMFDEVTFDCELLHSFKSTV